jgi:PKD repeat protein
MPRAFAPAPAWRILAAALVLFSACEKHKANLATPSGGGGALTVSISASATSGRAPLDVQFTSDVHGGDGVYRYLWTFGDGRTSTAANPRVQFLSGGSFDVRLEVQSGDQTVTSSPIAMRLDSDVRLACAADPAEGIAPVAVSFRADAQGGNGTFAYRWDFGDGTSSTATSAIHTYATAGAYRQVLTVTSGGASAVCSNVVTVYGVFRVTCRATPVGGNAVQFHAIPTFCLFNDCDYAWSFGGPGSGSSVRTARPLFTYAGPGTYTAHLDASTNRGAQAASCQVTVTVP